MNTIKEFKNNVLNYAATNLGLSFLERCTERSSNPIAQSIARHKEGCTKEYCFLYQVQELMKRQIQTQCNTNNHYYINFANLVFKTENVSTFSTDLAYPRKGDWKSLLNCPGFNFDTTESLPLKPKIAKFVKFAKVFDKDGFLCPTMRYKIFKIFEYISNHRTTGEGKLLLDESVKMDKFNTENVNQLYFLYNLLNAKNDSDRISLFVLEFKRTQVISKLPSNSNFYIYYENVLFHPEKIINEQYDKAELAIQSEENLNWETGFQHIYSEITTEKLVKFISSHEYFQKLIGKDNNNAFALLKKEGYLTEKIDEANSEKAFICKPNLQKKLKWMDVKDQSGLYTLSLFATILSLFAIIVSMISIPIFIPYFLFIVLVLLFSCFSCLTAKVNHRNLPSF